MFCKKRRPWKFHKIHRKWAVREWRRCFPMRFPKFLRSPLLTNTSGGFLWHFQTWCYEIKQNRNYSANLKGYSGQYSVLIQIYIVTGMKNYVLFFQNVLTFIDLFYRYHYICYFIYSDCMWRHVPTICREAATGGVLKNFANLTGKHLCWSRFLIKLQARPATLLERDSNTDVFLWN